MSRGTDKSSSHIYYGTIDALEVTSATQTKPETTVLGQNSVAENLSNASKQQQQNIANLELQKAARFVPAPTLDSEIKTRLRELGQPICLFGEGPYERRERLRFLLAQQPAKQQEVHIQSDTSRLEQQRRLFFSRGGPKLEKVRLELARYSLPRAIKRLQRDKIQYSKSDPLDIENYVISFNRSIASKLEGYISQVGSDRPMCCAKFSPNGDAILATSSWSPSIRLWKLTECEEFGVPLESHTERINSLCWNPYFKTSAKQKPPRNQKEILMESVCDTSDTDSTEPVEYSQGWHLISGSFDTTIQIWNLSNYKPLSILKGHEDRVNRVECHPSAKYLASTSHDETWRFWDIEREEEILVQEGHASAVYGIKFHPDGSLVYTGDTGGIIRAWDLRTGRTVLPLLGHVKQILGITVNPWRTNQLATCSDDNTVRVWDIRKQRCIDVILAHNKLVSDVVYEPTHGRYLISASFDSTLKLWSSTDFSCSKILMGSESRIMGIDIAHNGSCFASVSYDRTFKLWTQTKDPVEDSALVPCSARIVHNCVLGIIKKSIQLIDVTYCENLFSANCDHYIRNTDFQTRGTNIIYDTKNKVLGLSTKFILELRPKAVEKLVHNNGKDLSVSLASTVLLLLNSNPQLALNSRLPATNENSLLRELHLIKLVLLNHPKCTFMWAYRRYLIKNFIIGKSSENHLLVELEIVTEILVTHPFTYEAMNHWKWVSHQLRELNQNTQVPQITSLLKIIKTSPQYFGPYYHLATILESCVCIEKDIIEEIKKLVENVKFLFPDAESVKNFSAYANLNELIKMN